MCLFSLFSDNGGAYNVDRNTVHSCHIHRNLGLHLHPLDHGRIRATQQHSCGQSFYSRTELHHHGRHVPMLPDNICLARQAHANILLPNAHFTRAQLLHDLRRTGHQDQQNRQNIGRQQEEDNDQETSLHERHGSGRHHLYVDLNRGRNHRVRIALGTCRLEAALPFFEQGGLGVQYDFARRHSAVRIRFLSYCNVYFIRR